jgi:hypothetical protein
MSRTSAAPAATEPTPTPPPASEQRAAAPPTFRDLLRLVVARRDPSVEAGRAEAYDLYGDDPELALAAFAARTHPLQRTCNPPQIEETRRMAAESFARLPAKRG